MRWRGLVALAFAREHEADRVAPPAATPHDDVYRLNGGLDSGLAGAVPQKQVNHGVRAGLQGGAE
ncbi:hypothetical protein RVV18_004717 [Burkholderia ambifaria]|nr:hypothetical protein [Burkholderia ambifaria]